MELKETNSLSVIFITHDFRIVRKIADEVIVMYGGKIVEYRDKISIMKEPLHPYTKGLIESIPPIEKKVKRLNTIEGEVPDIFQKKDGCPFWNRCKFCKGICKEKFPEGYVINNNYKVYCHLFH